MGVFLAFLMLIGGIVGICTRNSAGKAGTIITTVLYWIGGLVEVSQKGTYGDLPIWGVISFIFGAVFLIAAIKTKAHKK